MAASVRNVAELDNVIIDLGHEPGGALVAMADFFLFINRAPMIVLAARNNVPAVYPWREVVTAGGLLYCGCGADVSWEARKRIFGFSFGSGLFPVRAATEFVRSPFAQTCGAA